VWLFKIPKAAPVLLTLIKLSQLFIKIKFLSVDKYFKIKIFEILSKKIKNKTATRVKIPKIIFLRKIKETILI
jgi:hypothetical protein